VTEFVRRRASQGCAELHDHRHPHSRHRAREFIDNIVEFLRKDLGQLIWASRRKELAIEPIGVGNAFGKT
jgi:hypothetical protein